MDIKELEHFLNSEGQLTLFPSKRKKKLMSLIYLIQKFDLETVYTEKEVNELLKQWHTFCDPATLRRELYNHHFLNRDKDGTTYWCNKSQPTLDDLLNKY